VTPNRCGRSSPSNCATRPAKAPTSTTGHSGPGDLGQQHTSDAFIASTPLSTWHGDRLTRHLIDHLRADLNFLELNIHTLHTLIRIHPDLLTDPAVTTELSAKIEHLLDESPIAAPARGELEALRYAIALAARH
jgi:hypothetical protein